VLKRCGWKLLIEKLLNFVPIALYCIYFLWIVIEMMMVEGKCLKDHKKQFYPLSLMSHRQLVLNSHKSRTVVAKKQSSKINWLKVTVICDFE
jgi:hypothetical protein